MHAPPDLPDQDVPDQNPPVQNSPPHPFSDLTALSEPDRLWARERFRRLREELLEMRRADLELRQRLVDQGALFGQYNEQMARLHRRHNDRSADILAEHGWPDRLLVGDEGAAAAWMLLQHAVLDPELMRSAIPLLERSVNTGGTEPRYLALAVDRIRTLEGRCQVYGTQHDWDESGLISPLPIEDPRNVDARRDAVGLEPLLENTRRLQAQAEEEGELPPTDLDEHRRGADEWARSVGWRSVGWGRSTEKG